MVPISNSSLAALVKQINLHGYEVEELSTDGKLYLYDSTSGLSSQWQLHGNELIWTNFELVSTELKPLSKFFANS